MDMKAVLKAVLFTPGVKGRWGLPLVIEGPPGAAKTAHVEAAARTCGLHLETIIASLREPADFNGLPIPIQKDGRTRVVSAPPHWAATLVDAERGVAFFDEINTAPPSVQAALLRVILDGVVGDSALPATVRFLAAMNPTEQAAGGWDLAPPLANRLGHWTWESPDAQLWADWLIGGRGDGSLDETVFDPEQEEKRVLKVWDTPFAKARGLVAGFVRARPGLLLDMPKAGSPNASKAWPSPRTWELATRAIAGAEVHALDAEASELLMSSFVGSGPARELAAYRRNLDLPDPADVLDGKVKFTHNEKKLDRTAAVISGCVALVTPTGAAKRNDRAVKLWTVLEELVNDAQDLAAPAARVLVLAKLFNFPEAKRVLTKVNPTLVAAGIGAES